MTSYELIKILKEYRDFILSHQSFIDIIGMIHISAAQRIVFNQESKIGNKKSAQTGEKLPGDIKEQIFKLTFFQIFRELDDLRNGLTGISNKLTSEYRPIMLINDSIGPFISSFEGLIKNDIHDSNTFYEIAININNKLNELAYTIRFLTEELIANQELNENESGFSLVIDSIKTFKDLTIKLVAIENLYSELCSLFKISESEFPLRIRKVETGSAVVDLIGNAAVLGCVVWFVKEGVKYLYRTYTTEGKIASIPKQLEAADSILQFTNKLEENGLDVAANREEIQKVLFRVTESLNDLLADQPKIKINGEEISVGDELEQKFLKDSEQLLLGEGEDQNS